MFNARIEEVFISSPSDAIDDKKGIKEAIYDFNANHGKSSGFIFLPVTQESHGYSEMGAHPQTILNRQAVNQCDLLIGCFRSRFGTATDSFGSGTEEEISIHMSKSHHVAIFFSEEQVKPTVDNLEQLKKLNDFKERIRFYGVCENYSSTEDLRNKVVKNLLNYSRRISERGSALPDSEEIIDYSGVDLPRSSLAQLAQIKSDFRNNFYKAQIEWGQIAIKFTEEKYRNVAGWLNKILNETQARLLVILNSKEIYLTEDLDKLGRKAYSLTFDPLTFEGSNGKVPNLDEMEELLILMAIVDAKDWSDYDGAID
jgi:hypothetical protein